MASTDLTTLDPADDTIDPQAIEGEVLPPPTGTDLEQAIAAKRAELADLQQRARAARAADPAAKPAPRRIRFTKSTVRALPVPALETVTYWDIELTGLGLRIAPTGLKVYFLQGRTRASKGVKLTIGRADQVTTEQAREAARQHIAALALGRDPAAELRAARQAERDRQKAATVDQAWEDFATAYLPKKRVKTQTAYRSWYARHIKPAIGRMKLADLTRKRVQELHKAVTQGVGPSTGNRALAVLSSLLTYAVDNDMVASNVAKGAVSFHHEASRERTMSDAELTRLVGHLAASNAPEAAVVSFLLSTGARKNEALAMRWSDVNGPWWTVPEAVSKSKKVVRRPLNTAALDVLGKIERRGERVFAGVSESRMSRWWQDARKQLGLDDLRVHDLRHAAASIAINAGATLSSVGKMLGHGANSAAMTQRYSHVHDDQLAAASTAVSDRLKALRDAVPVGNG